MSELKKSPYDLIIIGAGPAGYVAAIRASQLGLKVACIEKEDTLGGTCLNVGCIPSKALLESTELWDLTKKKLADHGVRAEGLSFDFEKMMRRKNEIVQKLTRGVASLFRKHKIDRIQGMASLQKDKKVLVVSGDEKKILEAERIILAPGSIPVRPKGIDIDQRTVLDSSGALALTDIPKEFIVIGGGYIGIEMASVYHRLGSRVTVVEMADRLIAGLDRELGSEILGILKKDGMNFRLGATVSSVKIGGGKASVALTNSDGQQEELSADKVLVAVGRRPRTEGIGLEEAGVAMNARGFIEINERFETSVPGIYAIGDAVRGPMLAHKGSEEGVAVAEIIAGQAGSVNYGVIPSVVYTWPEIASVGLSEEEATSKKIDFKKYKFPFSVNGRSMAMGESQGFVKLLADKKTDRLIGAHLIGPKASELVASLVMAMEFKASAEDIARTVHAHPTLSEAIHEAALGLGDGALHL